MDGKIYEFGEYVLDVGEQRLRKNGTDFSLPPKVFEVLTALVERHNQLVGYDELMEEVWQDTFVEETNLRYSIHLLRKTFDEDFIETVPKRGYRFNADVKTYTTEEFIKKYASGEKDSAEYDSIEKDVSEITKNDSQVFDNPSFFRKAIGLVAITLLMAIVGFSAYYFWQTNPQKESKNLKKIAVLPFTIVGEPNEKQIEKQKAIADSLIFNLKKIKGLEVVPINRIQDYFGKNFESFEAGRNLDADEILVGTFRLEGNLTKVNARHLRVKDGETLWAKDFEFNEENRVLNENLITLPIARQAEIVTTRQHDIEKLEKLELSRETKQNYLDARDIIRKNDFGRREEVASLFEKILAENPNWALANAGYAESLILMNGTSADWEKVKNFANKAIELDDKIASPYITLGIYHQIHWEWEKADESFKKAIELEPENASAYFEYGITLDLQRRFGQAEIAFKKALEIEPFSPLYNTFFCEHLYYDRRYPEAIEQCKKVKLIEPTFYMVDKKLIGIYLRTENYDDLWKLQYSDYTESDLADDQMAQSLAKHDMETYWKISLKNYLDSGKKGSPNPVGTAKIYAELKDKEKTLEYLKIATENPLHEPQLAFPDPAFDFIRKEPEFIELMKKINLVQ